MHNSSIFHSWRHTAALTLSLVLLLTVAYTLPAQTDSTAISSNKWEIGLRMYDLEFGRERFQTDYQSIHGASFRMGTGVQVQYRNSEKLFWRFGLGTSSYRYRQEITTLATMQPQSERGTTAITLMTMVGLGHTFSGFKHPRLSRFRASTGLMLTNYADVFVKTKNVAYSYDQAGNATAFNGSTAETHFQTLVLSAFGLVEMRIARKLHIGLEYSYGILGSKASFLTFNPDGSLDEKLNSYRLQFSNGLFSPTFLLNYSF